MLKKLLEELFEKVELENNLDNKTKNGISRFFVETVLEERYNKPNYISSRSIKGYYEKYVEKKENKSGEPNSELKNLISNYLGYTDFLDFETKNFNGSTSLSKSDVINKIKNYSDTIKKWVIPIIATTSIASGIGIRELIEEPCISWKTDHYEKVDCNSEFSIQMLKDLNIDNFKKVNINKIENYFINGKAVIWYGKSTNGNIDFFNSRGVHPITGKELRPITQYIIDKYIKNQNI